jgi:phosphoribosylanthranilate isomerase
MAYSMAVKIKICGITNSDDAVLAVRCGADALGFNFYAPSPRYISPDTARAMIEVLPSSVRKIGVFVNESLETIAETVKLAGLDAVQLHGDEPAAFVREVANRPGCEVIKAFRVGPGFEIASVYECGTDTILLDAHANTSHGGTGTAFDWAIAKRVAGGVKLYLAGGLSEDNVRLAVSEVMPYAVDACSLIESTPGKKDPDKLRRFILAAKMR